MVVTFRRPVVVLGGGNARYDFGENRVVETANEREKLMYRIKLHIDPQIIEAFRGYAKPGIRTPCNA